MGIITTMNRHSTDTLQSAAIVVCADPACKGLIFGLTTSHAEAMHLARVHDRLRHGGGPTATPVEIVQAGQRAEVQPS